MTTITAAGRSWHFSHSLGRPTSEHNGKTGGFVNPVDVAVAPDDILFVLNRGYGVEVPGFAELGSGGVTISADGGRRVGKTTLEEEHIGDFARTHFTWPTGLALSRDGNVYVSDEYEDAILVFPPDRIYEHPWFDPNGEEIGQWGESGSGIGKLAGPSGIEFDAEDNLLVVESGNHRVQRFTKGGEHLACYGGPGSGSGQLSRPWGICLDGDENMYVADWGNGRVQKLAPDGRFLMSFGGSSEDGGGLDHPAGVAVDSDGDVYVADWGNRRVAIFEPNGEVITALYGDALELSKAGEYILRRDPGTIEAYRQVKDKSRIGRFLRPIGIAIDQEDRVIVTDTAGRLQVYAKEMGYVEPELKLEPA